jgi:hypothetical protein
MENVIWEQEFPEYNDGYMYKPARTEKLYEAPREGYIWDVITAEGTTRSHIEEDMLKAVAGLFM